MDIKTVQKHNTPVFKGIYNSRILKKGLEFAADNGALFAAGTSLVLSTTARPLAILATPNTDKENKQYACAKSISSTLAGYLLMLGASLPVARAMKKIDKNPKKYLKKETLKNFQETGKSLNGSKKYVFATQLFKLGLGFVIAMPKSFLTGKLIPKVMDTFFPQKKEKETSKNISFGSKMTLEPLAKSIGKTIDTQCVQKLTDKFHDTNFPMHIMAFTDAFTTYALAYQIKNSKQIEENKKNTLICNTAISTGLSIAGGYTLDKVLDKPTEKFIKKFAEANKNSPKLDKYIEGIKIAKPVLILGGIYYIAIPLISTFLAERFMKNK